MTTEPVREDFLDFETAWRLQREGLTHTDQRCSAVQADGGFLCDCGAVITEWQRRVATQQGKTAPVDTPAVPVDVDVDAVQQRADAATPGPWTVELLTRPYPQRITNGQAVIVAQTYTSPEFPAADAEFIAGARTDVPKLIACIRELEQQITDALALHVENDGLCTECVEWCDCDPRGDDCTHGNVGWPCKTVAALTRKAGGP